MKRLGFLLILSLALCSTRLLARPTGEDLAILEVLNPTDGQLFHLNSHVAVSLRVSNTSNSVSGTSTLRVTIRDRYNTLVYDDSTGVAALDASEIRVVNLSTFSPSTPGYYSFSATLNYTSDPNTANNSLSLRLGAMTEMDVNATKMLVPAQDTVMHYGTRWAPRAVMFARSATDLAEVPMRILLLDSSGKLVFSADTIQESMLADSVPVTVVFPSMSKGNDLARLAPGRYRSMAIARLPIDGDRTNDTTSSQFTIRADYDVTLLDITSPRASFHASRDTTISIAATVRNTGLRTLSSVRVIARIVDNLHSTVYLDSQTIASLAVNTQQLVTLRPFRITPSGEYALTVLASPVEEDVRADDTLSMTFAQGLFPETSVRIDTPRTNATYLFGSVAGPVITVRNTSTRTTIPVNLQYIVRTCSGAIATSAYQRVAIAWNVPLKVSQSPLRLVSLKPGCYTLSVSASSTDGDLSSSDSVTFTVRAPHNLILDSLVSPSDLTNVLDSAILRVHIRNEGLMQEAFRYLIRTRLGTLPEEVDTVTGTLPAETTMITTLPMIHVREAGFYTVTVEILTDSMQYGNVGSETARFHFGHPVLDIESALFQVLTPEMEVVNSDELHPTVLYSWDGGYSGVRGFTASYEIRSLVTHALVYTFDRTVFILPNDRLEYSIDFPDYRTLHPDLMLPDGEYAMRSIASLAGDENHANDTLESFFYIGAASVPTAPSENAGSSIYQSLSGETLVAVSTIAPSRITARIYDLTGRCVAIPFHHISIPEGESRLLLPTVGLPHGEYLVAETIECPDRSPQRITLRFAR